jgi:hypothetical protein
MARLSLIPLVAAFFLACHPSPEPEAPPASIDEPEPLAEAQAVEEPTGPAAQPIRDRAPGTIFRDELVRATHDGRPGYLMGQLGPPEPHKVSGRFRGWRILEVFPDDPELCRPGCDLRPNDVILTVNGSPLERPEHLSELVQSIPELNELKVRLIRDNQLHERTYAVVDG